MNPNFKVPRVNCLALILVLVGVEFDAGALTTNDLGPHHTLKLTVQRRYLPHIPVLVRVEVWNAQGPERALWDAEAQLQASDRGVGLSTNRVRLRNGVGSALVALSGGTEFDWMATVGGLEARRSVGVLSEREAVLAGGTLSSSTDWSGIIRVTNDVVVPAGTVLTIHENTLVLIDGAASGTTANDILVNGRIETLGTEDDPITITCGSTNLSVRWGQIRHNNAQASIYRHTSITRAGRGSGEGHTGTCPVIRSTNSRITFDHCNLTDYAEESRSSPGFGKPGKVAQASGSDLVFMNCLFQRARMGPEIAGTALACTNTWIMDMPGPDDADGIYLHDQSAGQSVALSGCVIARGDDDGIDTLGSSITVENCILRDWNNLAEDAKAISVFNGSTTIKRSLIVDSTAGIAAKWSSGSATRVVIERCTLARNLTGVLAYRKDNAPGPFIDIQIANSIVWGGDAVHSDFGSTNFTIRYATLSEPWPGEGNLSADPLFLNPAAGDFGLQPGSPCIDTGDPTSATDPDSSRADMGWVRFSPPAPRLRDPKWTGTAIQFEVSAYPNRAYAVESTTNLASDWQWVRTNFQTNANTPIEMKSSEANRFYRLRVLR